MARRDGDRRDRRRTTRRPAPTSSRPRTRPCLTDGPMNLAPMALMGTHLGKHVHQVARAFREGGGVPYAEYRPEFTDVMDGISRVVYDAVLVDAVPAAGRRARRRGSTAGIRVADVACGTGHALVVLGTRVPDVDVRRLRPRRRRDRPRRGPRRGGAGLDQRHVRGAATRLGSTSRTASTRCSCSTRCTTRSIPTACSRASNAALAARRRGS